MQILATTQQMKELDRIAIEDRHIPSLDLMEQAAAAVAEVVTDLLRPAPQGPIGRAHAMGFLVSGEATAEEQAELEVMRSIVESKNTDPAPRVALFCGPGNNGGDGIAAARLLMDRGYQVRAFLVGDRGKMTPDARAMEAKLVEAGGQLEPFDPQDRPTLAWLFTCDAMVDALFGVGLKRPLTGAFLQAVQLMNQSRCPVVSCDLPSGVDGDTGEILGEAVRARMTVTFTCAKPGLYLAEGGPRAGEVRVAQIGIPHDLIHHQIHRHVPSLHAMTGDYPLPPRPATAHKGDFGKLFLLAGSEGFTGAPVLAARAAVRTGAGLVFLGVPRDIYPIVAVKCDEAMPFPLPEDYEAILAKARSCDVALIGPGLGRSPAVEQLILRLLADLDIPVVLDADGINALAGHIDVLDGRTAPTVLTPHDGEFHRLAGCPLPISDRLTAAREFSQAHRCILVLKGHGTVTADQDGNAWINTTGNPGMAKGGSGDVLAGMLAALWGQKHLWSDHTRPGEVAATAVYYHGAAGDHCARRFGEYAMTPGDMIEALPQVLQTRS